MRHTENLRAYLEKQHELLDGLELAVAEIEKSDLVSENEKLRSKAEAAEKKQSELEKTSIELANETEILKQTLNERLLTERLGLLKMSNERLSVFFDSAGADSVNRLSAFESKYNNLLKNLKEATDGDIAKTEPLLKQKISEAEIFISNKINELRELSKKKHDAVREAMQSEADEIKDEPLPANAESEARRFRFNAEMKFGTKVVNIAGMLLILLGVVFGAQYTFVHLLQSDALKGAAAFFIGILFLTAGIFLQNRSKTRNVFAVGLTAGGIGILYASAALSYFLLNIFTMLPAAVVCIMICAAAFYLSIKYESKTIACFAFIGGYLPITAITSNAGILHGAMAYFTLLNVFAIILAAHKKWSLISGVSFLFNTAGTFYLLAHGAFRAEINIAAGLIYLTVNFCSYLVITLINTKKTGRFDIALLAANTFFNCVIVYGFINGDPNFVFEHNGLLAVGYCVLYGAGAAAAKKFLPGDKRLHALLFLTALTFAVLTVPMQFGQNFLTVGWMLEAVALISYGALKREPWFERTGWIIMAFAAAAMFLSGSWVYFGPSYQTPFFTDYTAVILGFAAVAAAYVAAERKNPVFGSTAKGKLVAVYRYAVIILTMFYFVYAASFIYVRITSRLSTHGRWLPLLQVFVYFICAVTIKHIPYIKDKIVNIISLCAVSFGLFAVVYNNMFSFRYGSSPEASLAALIAFNVFAVLFVYDGVKSLIGLQKKKREALSLVTSLFALFLVSIMLLVQFELGFNNMALSALGMCASLFWIIFGFVSRNRTMRLFGLGFSIFATSKLFLLDLWFLQNVWRIASYFLFGAVLIAISYVYQHYNKKFTA